MPLTAPTVISDHYFKVSVPGITIGAFNECHGLSLEYDVFEWAEGGNNEFVHHLPGRIRYPYLVLNSGLVQDDALQKWVAQTGKKPELKEVTIELTTQDQKAKRSWVFADAYPIHWSGPTIAAHGAGLATESLHIVHSGLKTA
jgi:phage tail-like protein